ncbi:hypothetical protein SS50377_26079 [Spironucleus salmonicida]|uniref:Uncharacterized protein n=1 Tax=Spironucleus salmonicida TaxID=348837 RepID=V6LEP0_9EUKA|nr:hypothetical protein SS50377_26079 [Spironucleus salmonicida]|eukprot:EST42723.1 Hypothetical protein SS50377_17645 [Spironucleus salmonicida]
MLHLLQFTCFDSASSVQYDYASASATFTAQPLALQSDICRYLDGRFAVPTLTLGRTVFVASSIAFSATSPLVLRLECPTALCTAACALPLDADSCRACQQGRQWSCQEAALASIASIQFDFHAEQVQMVFSPGIYLVQSLDARSCLLGYTIHYFPEKIVFTGVPFLCQLQLSDAVRALMARKQCKPPIGSVPQDCPWVQLVVNGEVLNVAPYYEADLLGLTVVEVDCAHVLPAFQPKCEEVLGVANSNLESTVHFQLAVAAERNIGKTAAVDMPVASAIYFTGEALVEELEGDADCYQVISLSAFQDHVSVTFAANAGAVNCQQHVYDRALLQIQGVTTQFYKLSNEVPSLPEQDGSVILNTTNAENATEFGGNLTIALDGRRSAQYLYIQYIQNDIVTLEEYYKINNALTTYRNITLFVFDTQICISAQPLPWVVQITHDSMIMIHIGNYEFAWQQQLSNRDEQYCNSITKQESGAISNLLKQQDTISYVNIEQEYLPIFIINDARLTSIFWKQLVVMFIGQSSFAVLIFLIAHMRARNHSQPGQQTQ